VDRGTPIQLSACVRATKPREAERVPIPSLPLPRVREPWIREEPTEEPTEEMGARERRQGGKKKP